MKDVWWGIYTQGDTATKLSPIEGDGMVKTLTHTQKWTDSQTETHAQTKNK
jgi:hypothetical protein